MTSYALIVNPCSGRGKSRQKAEELRQFLVPSSSVVVYETNQRGDATERAASVGIDVDRVIAVGGDGTLNEVLNGLLERPSPDPGPALGFLPAGTGNAAARAFGFPSDPASSGRALIAARSHAVDVGMVRYSGGERAFLLWLGAGWDAALIEALHDGRKGHMGVVGMFRSAPRCIRAVTRYAQPPVTVKADCFSEETLTSVIVANVGTVPFGGSVAEDADPRDGRLDLLGVPRVSVLGSIRLGFLMLTRCLSRSTAVAHGLATHIALESDGEVPFQLDGEPMGQLPTTVTVNPGAIRLLTPER